MICPYCEVEITMAEVDAEDGCCPECGTLLPTSAIFMDQDDDLDAEIDDLDDLDDLDI